MADEIFPELRGLKWDTTKKPQWSTKIHETASGKETAAAYWSYPKWFFGLSYEVLEESDVVQELRTIGGFFLARKGRFEPFLYRDETDCVVYDQTLGTGDASRTTFQLVRSFGDFTEPMKAIDSRDFAPMIYLDGSRQVAGYTIGATGLVTFDDPPGEDVRVSADFAYLFRCRFMQDEAEFSQFMKDLWELKKLEFVSKK